jgi:hypothetical protein
MKKRRSKSELIAHKKALTKSLEAEFVRDIRKVLTPMKAAIRKQLDSGKAPHDAVSHVFREHDLRGHLKRLIPAAMVKAAKHGG